MATLKRRLHKKNATGYDTIHFETESDLVLLSDGTTLTNKLKSIDSSIAAKLPLSGGTLTGNLNGQYFTGTWLQTTSATDLGRTCNKICVLDESGWIYYRTPAELLSDAGGAKSSHTHDDRYYTEAEVNSFLNNKANTNHTHSGYATTAALNGLTTRVSNLEGSVDMSKLVASGFFTSRYSYREQGSRDTEYRDMDLSCNYNGTATTSEYNTRDDSVVGQTSATLSAVACSYVIFKMHIAVLIDGGTSNNPTAAAAEAVAEFKVKAGHVAYFENNKIEFSALVSSDGRTIKVISMPSVNKDYTGPSGWYECYA